MSSITITPLNRPLRAHPSVRDTIRDTASLTWRALKLQRRTPEQFFDVTLAPVIFVLMFTYIFGGAIAGDVSSYLPMAIPGILAQTTLQSCATVGVQLREDMEKGVFDRFRAMPIARIAPLAGPVIASSTRYAIATVITIVMGIALGYRPGGGVIGVLAAGILAVIAGWSLSWIFTWLGTMLKSAQGVQGIGALVMFPLTFLSNALVPPSTMPHWLQNFVNVNPVTHIVSAMRDLMNNNDWTLNVVWSLAGCAVVVLVFAPLALWSYRRKI